MPGFIWDFTCFRCIWDFTNARIHLGFHLCQGSFEISPMPGFIWDSTRAKNQALLVPEQHRDSARAVPFSLHSRDNAEPILSFPLHSTWAQAEGLGVQQCHIPVLTEGA